MLLTGEFKKLDLGSDLANFKKYGQSDPPTYNLDNIKDFKIVLVCGLTDLLSSPGDYNWLNEKLQENNQIKFLEYECGHLGLLLPSEHKINEDIID